MNAFRNSSLIASLGLVALLVIGLTAATAEAGGCHKSYGHHGSYGFHSVSYPSYPSVYNHAACYGPSCHWPTYQVAKPISYPVTYYDCYGQPYVVWQTSYSYLPY